MYKHYNSRQNNGIYIILIVTGKLNQIQIFKVARTPNKLSLIKNLCLMYKH
jgi:hypothetical protein